MSDGGLDRMEDLGCEIALFMADVLALVAGILYYAAIGITLVAAFRFPRVMHSDRTDWARRDYGIVHSIELCVGTALVWGLAHIVAQALDARQASRSRGINSTKLHGR